MRIAQKKYSYQTFIEACDEIVNGSEKTIQIITLTYKSEDEEKIFERFSSQGYEIDKKLGDVIGAYTKYNLYNTEKEVFYYFIKHPEYANIYLVFSFNGNGDIYRTLLPVIESTPNLHYLWLPPTHFDALKDKILKNKGAYLTYFHGKRLDSTNKDCRRPRFSRDIRYKGDDAKNAIEEFKFEYGVLPQSIEFVIPDVAKFRINKKGHYALFKGELSYFLTNVIDDFIQRVARDNKEMENARYSITKKDQIDVLESKKVTFELEHSMGFAEFEDFISVMKNNDFGSYNIRLLEGSVIFSANIVDEKKKNIFSVTSNGKQFTVIPKYNSSFTSIMRFHKFLIEQVDELTKVVSDNPVT